MDSKTIVAIVLGVLVLVSVVQAVQLYGLKEKVSTGTLKVSSSSSPTAASGNSGKTVGSVPSSVKELPSMVGGC
ncbi:MAG: hypothetical protein AABY26_02945 [Nanoarchaeota archaeon]